MKAGLACYVLITLVLLRSECATGVRVLAPTDTYIYVAFARRQG